MFIKSNILLIFSVIFLLNSCKSVDMFFNPNNYIPRDTPREKEYIYDTIRISNSSGEIREAAVSGIKPNKQLVFTSIGQTYTFKSGETIEIVSDGVDFSKTTFDIETNDVTKEIKLKLVDKDFSKIYLESKCQTIVRTGIDYVPKIEVAKGLDPEQIVVTPIFDDDCNRTGFQVRYGSSERGCKKEAKEVLSRFNDCAKKVNPPLPPPPCPECRLKRKLGIPCECRKNLKKP